MVSSQHPLCVAGRGLAQTPLLLEDNLISQHAYDRDLHLDNVAVRQETKRVLKTPTPDGVPVMIAVPAGIVVALIPYTT